VGQVTGAVKCSVVLVQFDGMDAENTEVRFSSHHDRVK
jgi:hypothetical protein